MNSEQCARPACPSKASAWLGYDYDARCAWLDDPADEEIWQASYWPLCEYHADSLKVPRGWFSVDRRAERPGEDAGAGAGADKSGHPGQAGRPRRAPHAHRGPQAQVRGRPNKGAAGVGPQGGPSLASSSNDALASGAGLPGGTAGPGGDDGAVAPGSGIQGTLSSIL